MCRERQHKTAPALDRCIDLILYATLAAKTDDGCEELLSELCCALNSPTFLWDILQVNHPIVNEASFCLLQIQMFKVVFCFISSSNMQAAMFMTCWQCSQNTWICPPFCTCWTWFPSCLLWRTHGRLSTLPQFWSELSGGQDYLLLLLSLVRLHMQTAQFMDQWPLVSDLSNSKKKSIRELQYYY